MDYLKQIQSCPHTSAWCWDNYVAIMNCPNPNAHDISYAIEAWANILFDYLGSNGGGEDALDYKDYMHSIGIVGYDNDMELANFYEDARWEGTR